MCTIESSDKLLTDIVNLCVIPKIALKYVPKLPAFADWVGTNCDKGEGYVKEFFVDARFVRYISFSGLL